MCIIVCRWNGRVGWFQCVDDSVSTSSQSQRGPFCYRLETKLRLYLDIWKEWRISCSRVCTLRGRPIYMYCYQWTFTYICFWLTAKSDGQVAVCSECCSRPTSDHWHSEVGLHTPRPPRERGLSRLMHDLIYSNLKTFDIRSQAVARIANRSALQHLCGVTWRHRSRDHLIAHMPFPIGGPLEPSLYL